MRVFVLGGSGTIGAAVVAELVERRHRVEALSRSESSDRKLAAAGARPLRGDLADPADWADAAISCDAIVQVAATFGDDMADVDEGAMRALLRASTSLTEPTRLIYTGGCWLYGETGDDMATEDRPFDPPPSFSWMAKHAEMLLKAPSLRTAVIHPAMVYDRGDGGVFRRFLSAARAGQPIEVWGSARTRWPLVESGDLVRVYCDLAERPGLQGFFNAAAEEGVAVGRIAATISEACAAPRDLSIRSVGDVMREHGAWAMGPTLDQRMSSDKLKAATGWTPRCADFAQVVFETTAGDRDNPA